MGQLHRGGAVEDLEVGADDLLDEVGAHDDPSVGDRGGHHGDLQRGDAHVVLADGRLGGLWCLMAITSRKPTFGLNESKFFKQRTRYRMPIARLPPDECSS